MRSLAEIFEDYSHYGSDAGHADKGSTHSYIEEYERLFAPFRTGCTFMEIGLALGWSLKMWCEYFSNSHIIGADISIVFDVVKIEKHSNLLSVIEADATSIEFLRWFDLPDNNRTLLVKTPKTFDIIIDDGSHMEDDQVKTFELLKHRMAPDGLYIIEDILSLDTNRKRFEGLHDNCEIIDLRQKKNRFDDVLIVYKF